MNNELKNRVFAHRGIFNNINIPENSLKAFKKAIDKNIDIELDIQLTKDKKIVVFHDYDLKRMTGSDKLLKDLTYNEIQQLKLLNTEEKIPLLEEVLNLVNGKVLINIEIKNTNKKKETLYLLNCILSNYKGDYIIQSFYIRYLILINKYYSNYKKGLLITLPEIILDYVINSKLFLKLLNLDFIAYNKLLIKNKKVQNIRRNIPIFAWTIKNNKEKENIEKYADSIIMNIKN